ncbi:Fatty acid transporter protein [Paramyrothecium foliicola]|nr:Fatty acid transporter protein [Paramyrothecium foliicola]
MPVPLAVAAPAAAAGLAYLNAKTSFYYDLWLLTSQLTGIGRIVLRARKDRMNCFYTLEDIAKSSHGSHNFVIFEGKTYTYAEVYDRVLRYATWLREKHGVKPKQIVGFNFQNSDNFIFLWWAIWALGAKPAFINYNLTGAPLAQCLKVATTNICLVDPRVTDQIDDQVKAELGDSVSFVYFTPDLEAQALSTQPVRYPDSDRSEDDPTNLAMLIYTSGTTGMPKPAIVSWMKCYVGGTMGQRMAVEKSSDVVYTCMPLYHSAAAILCFVATMLGGGTVAIGRKFSTKTFWPEVRASKATSIQYVGELLRYLLAAPPQLDPVTGEDLDRKHSVRIAYGNGLRPDVWDRFKDRFGIGTISELYTATEGTFGTWNISRNDLHRGAIGRYGWLYGAYARMNTAVIEVDWEKEEPRRDPKTGFCRRVAAGEPGEIISRLPSDDPYKYFLGYFNNQKATKGKVLRSVFKKDDAWFRSGDVVRWDDDNRIYFNDRIGDTFRWKSENVSTAEVSHALGLHPAVSEANVYGIDLPNHDGRAGCAAVTLVNQGQQPDRETMRSLVAHIRRELPRYAQPLFLRLLPDVGGQATGTFKQQKHILRQAGVRPGGDKSGDMGIVYWLVDDEYVPFTDADWQGIESGKVRL